MTHKGSFSDLICSRICHDLISPIGAVNNGVELMIMKEEGQHTPEIALVAGSATNASARIRLFRIAFGATSQEQTTSRNELMSILTSLKNDDEMKIEWFGRSSLTRYEAKLVLLAFMCLDSSILRKGRIHIRQDERGGWCLAGSADKKHVKSELWQILQQGVYPKDITPADVHFVVFYESLRQHQIHKTLNTVADGDEMRISFQV